MPQNVYLWFSQIISKQINFKDKHKRQIMKTFDKVHYYFLYSFETLNLLVFLGKEFPSQKNSFFRDIDCINKWVMLV